MAPEGDWIERLSYEMVTALQNPQNVKILAAAGTALRCRI
jgi:hypothetical protein